MSSRLHCPDEFTPAFRDAIARAVGLVYEEVAAEYDPSTGRDSRWFGMNVYFLLGPALDKALAQLDEVAVDAVNGSYEVTVGPHRLRPNKIGRDASDPIGSSFPRKSRVSVLMADTNRAQLTLGLEGLDDPIAMEPLVHLPPHDPTQWIIGHIGNGVDGLVAVYLCAPWLSDGSMIREWRGWVPIYAAGTSTLDDAPPPGLPDPEPGAVEIPEVEPQLLDDHAQEESSAS